MRGGRRTIGIAVVTILLAGCGSTVECDDEERFYATAVPGKRIEMPEGLDPLPPEKEMTVPDASPQAPPPPGTCLDAPPTLRTGADEEEGEDG